MTDEERLKSIISTEAVEILRLKRCMCGECFKDRICVCGERTNHNYDCAHCGRPSWCER